MLKKLLKYFSLIIILIIILVTLTNFLVITETKDKIISIEAATKLENIDCILVLGASIKGNYPSPMLEDRLIQSINLYNQHISSKILASGDHTSKIYDEVNVMKDYLVGHKIPSQDVPMDHAGISTYDSIYRAKHIFKVKKIIIVTQEYHLYRALYIAEQLNIEAYGISSNLREYSNQEKRDVRELLARTKDYFKSNLKVESTYLGEEIPISGNGDLTNDKL